MSKGSDLALTLEFQMRALRIAGYEREFRFWEGRKHRFDYAWPKIKLAVEVEGGVHIRGRHTRGTGFIKDCEKYNEAAILGWTVIRVHTNSIKDGTGVLSVKRALDAVERRVKR